MATRFQRGFLGSALWIFVLIPAAAVHGFQELDPSTESPESRALAQIDGFFAQAERFSDQGDSNSAGEALRQALEIAQNEIPNSAAHADCLERLGALERANNNLDVAVDFYGQSLAIHDQIDPEGAVIARLSTAIGECGWNMGDFDAAEEGFRRSVRTWESLSPGGPHLASSLGQLGLTLSALARFGEAELCLKEAIQLWESAENHVQRARMMINLSGIYFRREDFERQRQLLESALALLEEHAPHHLARAKALGNLREMYYTLGDFERAAENGRLALSLFEENWPETFGHAIELTGMGRIYSSWEQHDVARSYHLRALEIREKLWPRSTWVAESLHYLCHVEVDLSNFEKAGQMCTQALSILEETEPIGFGTACVHEQLAICSAHSGDLENAERHVQKTISIWEARGEGSLWTALEAKYHLAWVLATDGRPDEAMEISLDAESAGRERLRSTLGQLPEREALFWAASDRSGLDIILSLVSGSLRGSPGVAAASLDALIRHRGAVMDEMAARNRAIVVSDSHEVIQIGNDLAAARDRLAKLIVGGPAEGEIEAYRDAVRQARDEKEEAERRLAAVSTTFRRQRAQSLVGLEDVHASLGDADVLVAFARYNRYSFKTSEGSLYSAGVPSYVAIILDGSDPTPRVVSLGEADRIDEQVARFRRQLTRPTLSQGRRLGEVEDTCRYEGDILRAMVWDPIRQHLTSSGKVFVIPDGSLNLVGLESLPTGESSYLIEDDLDIWNLSAEREVFTDGASPIGQGLLALGDPAFDDSRVFAAYRSTAEEDPNLPSVHRVNGETYRGPTTTCESFGTMAFDSLPASGKEINEIIDLWTSGSESPALEGDVGVAGATGLTGLQGNETNLKALAPGQKILHLATHGFFLGGDCRSRVSESAARMSQEENLLIAAESPLLLSGLALAGANHRDAAGPDEEDGILTAEEIASLDLSSVEWAVLSACDTGVGEVSAGEGVFGLRRAFQIAGARTLIMSLWPVDDEVTRAWMRELYTNRFVKQMSTIDSVHEASLALLNERREKGLSTHPFYWAGFIASGDWR